MSDTCRLRLYLVWLVAWVGVANSTVVAQRAGTPEAARLLLVERDIIPAGISNRRVLESIRNTPRHELVPASQRKNAYYDMSLPIGDQQTISSPAIVAFMTEALDPQPTDKVLEIGTGSGYQAAVLSPLVQSVYTIEIVEPLGRRAERDLRRLGFENVHVKIGDGFKGWPEHAPFDKIIVTCSPEDVPKPLAEQLVEGGKMVVPVGERYRQVLYLLVKENGKLKRTALRPTLFVPMTGEAEQRRDIQPDPLNPAIANGSFELLMDGDHPFDSWYYQRQVDVYEGEDVPEGERCAEFSNVTPNRSSHVLQGFAIDGSRVSRIRVSADVKLDGVKKGTEPDSVPAIVVSFYDGQRSPLGLRWLGPWSGSQEWRRLTKTIRVPRRAREGILRVGLFGATGTMYVDQVKIAGVRPRTK